MRRRRRLSALIAGGVCGLAGLVIWAAFGGSSGIQYRTAPVTRGDVLVVQLALSRGSRTPAARARAVTRSGRPRSVQPA